MRTHVVSLGGHGLFPAGRGVDLEASDGPPAVDALDAGARLDLSFDAPATPLDTIIVERPAGV